MAVAAAFEACRLRSLNVATQPPVGHGVAHVGWRREWADGHDGRLRQDGQWASVRKRAPSPCRGLFGREGRALNGGPANLAGAWSVQPVPASPRPPRAAHRPAAACAVVDVGVK